MRLRHLIPTIAVVVCAVLGGFGARDDRCSSTDSPQFKCWLEERDA